MAEAVLFSEEGRPGRKLTRVALETFARRAWLNSAGWLKLAELGPSSGAASYLEGLSLCGWLLRRRAGPELVLYRLSDRGEKVLRGLRRQLERGD